MLIIRLPDCLQDFGKAIGSLLGNRFSSTFVWVDSIDNAASFWIDKLQIVGIACNSRISRVLSRVMPISVSSCSACVCSAQDLSASIGRLACRRPTTLRARLTSFALLLAIAVFRGRPPRKTY